MKFTTIPGALAAALLLVAPTAVVAKAHRHHGRLAHIFDHPSPQDASFFETSSSKAKRVAKKRGGSCPFPTDDPNLVSVTPDEKNAGWALSPDQECEPGSYCPFACKPGMVMNQWEPDSTYTYPSSMNGGLYCNDDGEIEKPFKGKPNCVQGSGAVEAVNKCGSQMSWCQTVLPGNEAMLIPTLVTSSATIAVPDISYWCSTAAHFYINPPGTGEEGCIWGDDSSPVGNWSPYVAGANTLANGETFVKIGWNPIWEDSGLKSTLPDFGVEIKCPDGGCNGLPCRIDPSDGEGNVSSSDSAVGAGGASFCVVTVSSGSTAQIVAFSVGSSSSSSDSDDSDDSESETTTSTPKPTPTSTSTSSSTSTSTTSTTSEKTTSTKESTTSKATTTKESTTSSTPTEEATTTTPEESKAKTTKTASHTTQFTRKTKSASADKDDDEEEDEETATTSHKSHPTVNPGIFHENGTTTAAEGTVADEATATDAASQAAPTSSKEGDAVRQQGSAAFASFVVAFIAAVCFI